MDNFLNQMASVRDRTAPLAQHFGIPNIRSFAVRYRINGGFEYLKVTPDPLIDDDYPESQGMESINNTELLIARYDVRGISRRYPKPQLEGDRIDYIVDPVWRVGELTSGIVCKLVQLVENSTTWDMKLIQKIGEEALYYYG